MKPRLNPCQAAPDAMKAVAALNTYVQGSGLEPSLDELIKMRASQISGCAYCLHMHPRERRERRADLPARCVARVTLYTDRERAALAWTEAVTLVSQTQAPDDIRRTAPPVFRGRGG
jgi:AhpD family alkylhydroperoxidase